METSKSFSEEAGGVFNNKVSFVCDQCGEYFKTRSNLKRHVGIHVLHLWNSKLKNIENEVTESKLKISAELYSIKELHIMKGNKCKCKVGQAKYDRKFCMINHTKYNWTKAGDREIISKIKKMKLFPHETHTNSPETDDSQKKSHACNVCDDGFSSLKGLVDHIQSNHKLATVSFLEDLES